VAFGRVYDFIGDGKCVVCDSYVRPCTLVRICDECNYGSYQGRCTICGGPGVSDAYYCKECTILEKDVSVCVLNHKLSLLCIVVNAIILLPVRSSVERWLSKDC
jgi:hypothetical protein